MWTHLQYTWQGDLKQIGQTHILQEVCAHTLHAYPVLWSPILLITTTAQSLSDQNHYTIHFSLGLCSCIILKTKYRTVQWATPIQHLYFSSAGLIGKIVKKINMLQCYKFDKNSLPPPPRVGLRPVWCYHCDAIDWHVSTNWTQSKSILLYVLKSFVG